MNRTWSVIAGLLLLASAVLVVGAALDWWTLSFQIGTRTISDGVVSLLLAGVSVAIALVVVLDLWDLDEEESRSIFTGRVTSHLPENRDPADLIRPTPTSTDTDLDWPEAPDPLGADVSVPFGHPPTPPDAAPEVPLFRPVEPVAEGVTLQEPEAAPDIQPAPAPEAGPEPVVAAHEPQPITPAPVPEARQEPAVASGAEPRLVVDLTDGPAPAHLLLEGGAGVIDLSNYSDGEIITSIAAGEAQVVELLLGEGYLTTDGPITDDDTAVLVFVSVTTDELVAVLTGHGYLASDGQITTRLDEARRFQAQPALRG